MVARTRTIDELRVQEIEVKLDSPYGDYSPYGGEIYIHFNDPFLDFKISQEFEKQKDIYEGDCPRLRYDADHRVHFEGLPHTLQGKGLATKIYTAVACKLDFIVSKANRSMAITYMYKRMAMMKEYQDLVTVFYNDQQDWYMAVENDFLDRAGLPFNWGVIVDQGWTNQSIIPAAHIIPPDYSSADMPF